MEVVKTVDNEATLEELKQLKDELSLGPLLNRPLSARLSGAQAGNGTGGRGAGLWQLQAELVIAISTLFCARQDGCESSWTSLPPPNPYPQDGDSKP